MITDYTKPMVQKYIYWKRQVLMVPFKKVVNEVQDLGTDYFFLGSQPFSQREGSLQGVPLLRAMSLTIFSHHDFSFQISYDGTHNQN